MPTMAGIPDEFSGALLGMVQQQTFANAVQLTQFKREQQVLFHNFQSSLVNMLNAGVSELTKSFTTQLAQTEKVVKNEVKEVKEEVLGVKEDVNVVKNEVSEMENNE